MARAATSPCARPAAATSTTAASQAASTCRAETDAHHCPGRTRNHHVDDSIARLRLVDRCFRLPATGSRHRGAVHAFGHRDACGGRYRGHQRSEEHTSELQSLMRNSYAVFCLQKKKNKGSKTTHTQTYMSYTACTDINCNERK